MKKSDIIFSVQIKFLIILISIFGTFQGCYLVLNQPDIVLKKEFNGGNIAVLNFSTGGSFLAGNVGKTAADKLTDALFLKGRFNVIDRSNVNNAQFGMHIKSSDILSADQIKKLGSSINAKFLILGTVQKIQDGQYFDPDSKNQLNISIRILSVKNSDVVGIASYSTSFKGNITKVLQTAMEKIVVKMAGS